ncbi:MAG: PmoA family protein [Planctomycetes bacterium]|nr:PmoA family protein [Planctomycetota bacterium]
MKTPLLRVPPAVLLPLLTLISLSAGSLWADPGLKAVEQKDGILVLEDDTKVLFYQLQHKSLDGKHRRANYVHPLYDLDGNVLTEDFPEDHLHHRGIFWAWTQVYVGEKTIGDSWLTKDFSWNVIDTAIDRTSTEFVTIRAQVEWKSPDWTDAQGQQKPIAREVVIIRVHKADDDRRDIDFQIMIRAVEERVRIGGVDNDKGYGGFSTRVRLPENTQFLGRPGALKPQRTQIDAGPWVDVSASYGNIPTVSGLTILCPPSLPGYPQGWLLRQKGSMQNPAYPGRHPVPLSTKKPTILRYRLVVHRGRPQPERIESWLNAYTGKK